jgi:hypothetical protein
LKNKKQKTKLQKSLIFLKKTENKKLQLLQKEFFSRYLKTRAKLKKKSWFNSNSETCLESNLEFTFGSQTNLKLNPGLVLITYNAITGSGSNPIP